MKTYQLERRQILPIQPESAWRFFSDPSNLRLITPPWLDFNITTRTPAEVYAGLIITYRIRPFDGMAVPGVSEITHVRPPHFSLTNSATGPSASGTINIIWTP